MDLEAQRMDDLRRWERDRTLREVIKRIHQEISTIHAGLHTQYLGRAFEMIKRPERFNRLPLTVALVSFKRLLSDFEKMQDANKEM